jgi:transposase
MGRVHQLQDSRQCGTARRGDSNGPFHVVRPASCALDQYRRRVWRDAFGPARPQMTTRSARARRSLHTGARLLTKRQQTRLEDLFSNQTACQDRSHLGHLPVHGHRQARARPEPWQVRQAIRDRLPRERCPYHARRSVTPRPNPQTNRPRILVRFDRSGTSNEPTEAVNGRLEHPLAPHNLTNHTTRSLLKTKGFKPHPRPHLR